MSSDILSQVAHYQKKINRYSSEGNNDKILYCVHKLKYMDVTVEHLEETGIGITVNSLRHLPGTVGYKCNSLVQKWKKMVAEEEKLRELEEIQKKENHTEVRNMEIDAGDDKDSDDSSCLQIAEKGLSYEENSKVECDDKADSYNPLTSREDYLSIGSYSSSNYNPTTTEIKTDYNPYSQKDSPNNYNNKNLKNLNSPSLHNNEDEYGHSSLKKESPDTKNIETSVHDNHKVSSKDKSEHRHSRNKSKKSSKDKKHSKDHHHSKQKDKSRHSDNHDNDKDKLKHRSKKIEDDSKGFGAALMGLDSPKEKKKKSHKKSYENEKDKKSKKSSEIQESKTKTEESLSFVKIEEKPAPPPANLLTSYKPLPKVPEKESLKSQQISTEEEGLNFMFSMKKNRQRKMYTGNSMSLTHVTSLQDLCVKYLLENNDLLREEEFYVIECVLEKATANQLFVLEDINPSLLDHTDHLWEGHCKRAFKSQKRQEMESWRDMYVRCTYENEEKLRNLTKNLQRKFVTKAQPKRTTQLAYIETGGKQPRSLKRAQVQIAPPSSSVQTAAGKSFSSGPKASLRDERQTQKAGTKKPRMAPLMAKTYQLHKKVCRR